MLDPPQFKSQSKMSERRKKKTTKPTKRASGELYHRQTPASLKKDAASGIFYDPRRGSLDTNHLKLTPEETKALRLATDYRISFPNAEFCVREGESEVLYKHRSRFSNWRPVAEMSSFAVTHSADPVLSFRLYSSQSVEQVAAAAALSIFFDPVIGRIDAKNCLAVKFPKLDRMLPSLRRVVQFRVNPGPHLLRPDGSSKYAFRVIENMSTIRRLTVESAAVDPLNGWHVACLTCGAAARSEKVPYCTLHDRKGSAPSHACKVCGITASYKDEVGKLRYCKAHKPESSSYGRTGLPCEECKRPGSQRTHGYTGRQFCGICAGKMEPFGLANFNVRCVKCKDTGLEGRLTVARMAPARAAKPTHCRVHAEEGFFDVVSPLCFTCDAPVKGSGAVRANPLRWYCSTACAPSSKLVEHPVYEGVMVPSIREAKTTWRKIPGYSAFCVNGVCEIRERQTGRKRKASGKNTIRLRSDDGRQKSSSVMNYGARAFIPGEFTEVSKKSKRVHLKTTEKGSLWVGHLQFR